MTTRLPLLRTVLLASPLALCGCAAPCIDVALRAQDFELDGALGASSSGVVATSSTDSLGLDQDEGAFSPRADLVAGPMRLTVDHVGVEFEGDGTVEVDFEFGGETISAGADVASRLDLGITRAVATFTILPLGVVHVGLGVGVALVDFEAELVEDLTATRIATDETAPVPFVAARVGGGIWRIDFDVLAGFLDVEIDDVDARYLDVEAMARLRLFDAGFHGDLVAGYRWMDIDVAYEDDGDDVDADIELSGPYIGLSIGL